MTSETSSTAAPNDHAIAIAFGVTLAAGLSTMIGAAIVFVPALVRVANRKTLACSLGLSAGVMIYVSFQEILVKSEQSFVKAGHGVGGAAIYSTTSFFAGILLMLILNNIIEALSGGHHHHQQHGHGTSREQEQEQCHSQGSGSRDGALRNRKQRKRLEINGCPCHSSDPAGDLDQLQQMAQDISEYELSHNGEWEGLDENGSAAAAAAALKEVDLEEGLTDNESDDGDELMEDSKERQKLTQTSMKMALAIALHNFPEGTTTKQQEHKVHAPLPYADRRLKLVVPSLPRSRYLYCHAQ